jgi:hypothetical protein
MEQIMNVKARAATRVRPTTSKDGRIDRDYVIYRLEEAGQTLLALPNSGYTTRLRTSSLDIVHSAVDGPADDTDQKLRPATPSSDRITRMDDALAWIPLIPRDRYVLRRIVGARSLVSPVTERHLFSWRRLGTLLGADHKAIQRWHSQGIDIILAVILAANAQRDGSGCTRHS